MMIDLNKNEIWKILDAIASYKKDYALTGAVEKTLDNITKKLTDVVK